MDNKVLNEVIENNNFLIPYLNQFRNNFNDKPSIKEIGYTTKKYLEYLKSVDCDIEEHDFYDGIIVINTHNYEQDISKLYEEINNSLKTEGYLFIVIRNKGNLKEKIEFQLIDEYKLIQEYIGDDNWKFLLYQKSTIK